MCDQQMQYTWCGGLNPDLGGSWRYNLFIMLYNNQKHVISLICIDVTPIDSVPQQWRADLFIVGIIWVCERRSLQI